jgi:hypothetical protein
MDANHPESEAPPRIARADEDTDRAPPMTDSEKLDRIWEMQGLIFETLQQLRAELAGLGARLRLLETAHNYRHPADAAREMEQDNDQI